MRLKKGLASRAWESLVLAIVGEQFDVGNEICGAVVSVRYRWVLQACLTVSDGARGAVSG